MNNEDWLAVRPRLLWDDRTICRSIKLIVVFACALTFLGQCHTHTHTHTHAHTHHTHTHTRKHSHTHTHTLSHTHFSLWHKHNHNKNDRRKKLYLKPNRVCGWQIWYKVIMVLKFVIYCNLGCISIRFYSIKSLFNLG